MRNDGNLMTDNSEMLNAIWRIVSLDLQTRSHEILVAVESALNSSLRPHFLPDNLSTLPAFANKLRHLTIPILGFNGQIVRAAVFLKLFNVLGCDAFIETGTHRGET